MPRQKIPLTQIKQIKSFGDSMYPLLHDGDIIYLQKIPFSTIQINDIVCFKKRNQLITHRVIYRTKSCLVTKGDNAEVSDGRIYPKDIIGVVAEFMRDTIRYNIDLLYLQQSTVYFKEIKKINHALQVKKIEFVYLKGLPLHLFYEGTHPRRIYADCDILIRKKQYSEVISLLKKLNYRKSTQDLSATQAKIKNKTVEETWYKKVHGLYVSFDVHLEPAFLMTQLGSLNALYSQQLIDSFINSIFKNKRHIRVENEDYPILSSADTILYLTLHFFHHNFTGMYRLSFLNTVFCHKSSAEISKSTESFISEIKSLRFTNFVYPGFFLLNKYYPDKRYKNLLQSLEKDVSKKQLAYMREKIASSRIFDEEYRVDAGVNRFLLIFKLSPYPIYRKIFILFNKRVLFSLFWVIYQRIKRRINRIPIFQQKWLPAAIQPRTH